MERGHRPSFGQLPEVMAALVEPDDVSRWRDNIETRGPEEVIVGASSAAGRHGTLREAWEMMAARDFIPYTAVVADNRSFDAITEEARVSHLRNGSDLAEVVVSLRGDEEVGVSYASVELVNDRANRMRSNWPRPFSLSAMAAFCGLGWASVLRAEELAREYIRRLSGSGITAAGFLSRHGVTLDYSGIRPGAWKVARIRWSFGDGGGSLWPAQRVSNPEAQTARTRRIAVENEAPGEVWASYTQWPYPKPDVFEPIMELHGLGLLLTRFDVAERTVTLRVPVRGMLAP